MVACVSSVCLVDAAFKSAVSAVVLLAHFTVNAICAYARVRSTWVQPPSYDDHHMNCIYTKIEVAGVMRNFLIRPKIFYGNHIDSFTRVQLVGHLKDNIAKSSHFSSGFHLYIYCMTYSRRAHQQYRIVLAWSSPYKTRANLFAIQMRCVWWDADACSMSI